MKSKVFTAEDVKKISKLAQIPLKSAEEEGLSQGFNKTIEVVNQLFSVDVMKVEPTSQVTGLENVFREDEIDTRRMLTRKQALGNAKKTYDGFFMVDQVIDK